MKKARFLVSHFDAGIEKFRAGETHDLTEETRLCIFRGAAEEVDAPNEPVVAVKADPAAAETATTDADKTAAGGRAKK